MKIHFNDDEYAEEGICNTYSENTTGFWKFVDCKKCLRLKRRYLFSVAEDEKHILKDMASMVEFNNQ